MKRFGLLIAALIAVRLVVMALAPVFDPSEARYAAISANMARTGDYIVPHFTYKGVYQSFDGKPPLVFQAGGLCCELLGINEFSVRLFPFLSAILLLWILYRSAKIKSPESSAPIVAVYVALTSVAFYIAAGLSMTDIPLACSVSGALLIYGQRERNVWWERIAIGVLLGAGMIVKGPVSMVMFGLPVLVDSIVNYHWGKLFDWHWLVWSLPVFLLVAVPWFVAMEVRNPGSVVYFFYNENFLRFISHDYGDKYGAGREAFRGVSVLWALVVTLPWSLLPLWKVLRNFKALSFSRLTMVRDFDLLAIVTIVGFWCLTSRVLVYYLFPVVPLFAVYVARNIKPMLVRYLAVPSAIIAIVSVIGMFVGGAFFSDKFQGDKTPFSVHGSTYAYEFYHGTHPDALKNGKK